MKARLAIIIAASLGLLHVGAPALAQDSSIQIPVPAPSQSDAVGNPQLRNFSLSGTVTQQSTAPAPVEPAARPAPSRQQTAQRGEPQREQAAPPPAASERRDSAPAALPTPTQSAEAVSPSGSEQLAPPTPAPSQMLRWDSPPAPAAVIADPPAGEISIFPWLLAALFFGGAAAWFFLRQRPRQSLAGAGAVDRFEAPPAPAPPRAVPPRAAPPPVPKAPGAPKPVSPTGGVVSTRLRPWLEIQFVPLRGVVDDQRAAVAFELTVFNSGSIPARDVLIEASLFNAGPQQDQLIQQFFGNPLAKGDKIPVIPPLQRATVETAVFLQRNMVVPIEIEGRALFVPLVGFNALYSWGTSSRGQTSASYLVGKQTKSEKLAPFRLDLGPRIFRNLAAREHELRLRK